ncbi:MAG TPA: hypothetical protein VLZ81_07825, partial [Blastocatellia bacterium]|nr:hypothetical protein [Blastocatellia bacterium]
TSAFAQAEPQSQTATGPGAHSQMRAPSSDRRYGPPTIQQQGRTPVYSGRTENAPLNPNSQVAKVPVNPPQVSGANATGFDFQLVHGVVLH